MAYTPTNWKDRVVEKPRTYRMQTNPDGTVTLIPAPGTVYEPGTPVNAPNLNKIEQGIEDAHSLANAAQATANAALPKTGGVLTGDVTIQKSRPKIILKDTAASGDGAASSLVFQDKDGVDIGYVGDASCGNKAIYLTSYSGPAALYSETNAFQVQGPGGLFDLWHTGKLRWNATSKMLEYNDGGTWRPVSGYGSGKVGKFTATTDGSTYTILNVTGQGALKFLRTTIVPSSTITVRVRIDGVLVVNRPSNAVFDHSPITQDFNPAINFDLGFKNSLLVEVVSPAGSYGLTVDYAYEVL